MRSRALLRERMSAAHIEYCAMTCRAKPIESFAEKLTRKHYNERSRSY